MRVFRAVFGAAILVVLVGCGGESNGPPASANKFRSYYGPQVTQVVVNKGQRRLYLMHERQVLKQYKIDLGFTPTGHKTREGDGKTPEGVYYIDRMNPSSSYHLSVGVSYPDPTDRERARLMGVSPGGDIMIHGRGAYGNAVGKKDWTAGCIAVSDGEIEEIFAMLRPGVPIVINP